MNEFVTWEVLATYAGCLTMVLCLTQLTKNLGFVKKIPTQLYSWLLTLVVLYPATYFVGGLNLEAACLIPFNAAIISLAANGGFEALNKFFPNQFK